MLSHHSLSFCFSCTEDVFAVGVICMFWKYIHALISWFLFPFVNAFFAIRCSHVLLLLLIFSDSLLCFFFLCYKHSGFMVCWVHYGRNGLPQNPLSRKGLYPYAIRNFHWIIYFPSRAGSFCTFPMKYRMYKRNTKQKKEKKSWIVEVCGIITGVIWDSEMMKKELYGKYCHVQFYYSTVISVHTFKKMADVFL